MTMSFNRKALGAFKKLGAVSLITATIFFTACNQTDGGKQKAPFVEGGASLILSPDNLTINVGAKTEDGSDIAVEGCTETTLTSDVETTLTATGTRVVLKGKITKLSCKNNKLTSLNVQGLTKLQKLYCGVNQLSTLDVSGLTSLQKLNCENNKLTALNVQGCTALKWLICHINQLTSLNVQGLTKLQGLYCYYNKLKAKAMTEILNALPTREASDDAEAVLYGEMIGVAEGNCKDYTQPEDLKKAFDDAKKRNWKLKKDKTIGNYVDI